jgi:2-dehydropantoate 2-reductase
MRFHVLGLGPIGSLFAHHLRLALPHSHSIVLIHKSRRQASQALAAGGVIRVENNGVAMAASGFESEVFDVPFAQLTDELLSIKGSWLSRASDKMSCEQKSDWSRQIGDRSDSIESLFVTTKSHTTLSAIRRLLPRLSNNSTIVLLQNGMGIYEQLIGQLFRNPEQRPHFILASNTHGAWLKRFYHVVHAGVGEVHFGVIPDPLGRNFEASLSDDRTEPENRKLSVNDLASPPDDESYDRYRTLRDTVGTLSSLSKLNISWKPMAELQVTMRRKLVVNSVINPLTAIMGCRNGDIFTSTAAHRIMTRVCQEAAKVYAAQICAEAQSWMDREGVGDQYPIGRVPDALTSEALETECLRVAELTKGNISSMLSDIRKGNDTEIEFMNGHLLHLGSTYRVQMPATATLLNLVKMRCVIPLDQKL